MLRLPLRIAALALIIAPLVASPLAAQDTQEAEDAEDAALSAALLRALGLGQIDEEELAAIEIEAAKHPLGSRENPVRADEPRGQRAYLDRLRCPGGKRPDYERVGNLGPGIYGSIVDLYVVECPGGRETEIVIDMYHPGYVEQAPVAGFTIVEP